MTEKAPQIALSENPTLFLLSLGCPKNRVDSEVMLGTLLDRGYQLIDEPEKAEVILINSCASNPAPSPMASIAITEQTPNTMPSTVSARENAASSEC